MSFAYKIERKEVFKENEIFRTSESLDYDASVLLIVKKYEYYVLHFVCYSNIGNMKTSIQYLICKH